MFGQKTMMSDSICAGDFGLRVLTEEEMSVVSGGWDVESSTNNDVQANYGISSGPMTEVSGVIGTAIGTAGIVVPGPVGTAMQITGGVISALSAAGYTTPQATINAGHIEYGMGVAESYGGQYGGSSFGNDFGDPNAPGSGTAFA